MSKQKHDRGNIKRREAAEREREGINTTPNYSRLAGDLVKRGLASKMILDARKARA